VGAALTDVLPRGIGALIFIITAYLVYTSLTEPVSVAPFERGEIGPDLFRAACRMGLEGLVSNHRDRPYRGGRQKHWIKVKNRSHPAIGREL